MTEHRPAYPKEYKEFLKNFIQHNDQALHGRTVILNAIHSAALNLHSLETIKDAFYQAFLALDNDVAPHCYFSYAQLLHDKKSSFGPSENVCDSLECGESEYVAVWPAPVNQEELTPSPFLWAAFLDHPEPWDKEGKTWFTCALDAIPVEKHILDVDILETLGIRDGWFWFAPKPDIDAKPCPNGSNRAAHFRDLLGLSHLNSGKQLVMYRIPAELIKEQGHARPTVFEGIWGMRFNVFAPLSSPAGAEPYGRTVDLSTFPGGALRDGVRERVCPSFPLDQYPDVKVPFEYLGPLTTDADTSPQANEFFANKLNSSNMTVPDMIRHLT